MTPRLRTFVKQVAIGGIGVSCVVSACAMLWAMMTPERASRLDMWAALGLLGLFVLPVATGVLLIHERHQRVWRVKNKALMRSQLAARSM